MRNSNQVLLHTIANFIGACSPLLLLPHLFRTLGGEGYGQLALIQIASFATLPLIDFGTSSTGPKWLADHKELPIASILKINALSTLLTWSVASVGAVIYIALIDSSLLMLLIVLQLTAFVSLYPPIYVVAALGLQGTYGVVFAVSRITVLILTYFFVRKPADLWIFVSINFLLTSIASIILLIIINRQDSNRIKSEEDKFIEAVKFLRASAQQFVRRSASIPIPLMAAASLQSLWGSSAVAIYSVAEKTRTICWQAINPLLSRYLASAFLNIEKTRSIINPPRSIIGLLLLMSIGSAVSYDLIGRVLKIPADPLFALTWIISSLAMVVCGICSFYQGVYFPILGRDKILTMLLWMGSFLVLICMPLSVKHFGHTAAILLLNTWDILAIIAILIRARLYMKLLSDMG